MKSISTILLFYVFIFVNGCKNSDGSSRQELLKTWMSDADNSILDLSGTQFGEVIEYDGYEFRFYADGSFQIVDSYFGERFGEYKIDNGLLLLQVNGEAAIAYFH